MLSKPFSSWLWPSVTIVLLSIIVGGMLFNSRSGASTPPDPADVPAGSRVLSMRAPEMFCVACEGTVESTLSTVPGILYADATIQTKDVEVIYDPKITTSDEILAQSIFDAYGREFVSDELYTPTSL